MFDTTKYNEIAKYLDTMYATLNEKYFASSLPQCVVTIQSSPRAYGHFSVKPVWKTNTSAQNEINISAEFINKPISEIASTMIHEMVHYYCQMNGITDVSRGGYYHNKNFKFEAEKRDLIIEYDNAIGFSITKPTLSLINFLTKDKKFQDIELYRITAIGETAKKESNSIRYSCPKCHGIARATTEMWLICGNCNETMGLGNKKSADMGR